MLLLQRLELGMGKGTQQMKVPGVLVAPGSCGGGEERQDGTLTLAEAPGGRGHTMTKDQGAQAHRAEELR